MARTLVQLRAGTLRRADMANGGPITNPDEVDVYINEAISDLYDFIVNLAGQEFYLAQAYITLITDQLEYNLPVDFYILKGVEQDTGVELPVDADPILTKGTITPLQPYMFHERWGHRGTYDTSTWEAPTGWGATARYRLHGSSDADGNYTPKIRFDQYPAGGEIIRIWYIPTCPVLNEGTDVWDGFSGWEEYVETDAAIRCLSKEESDTTALEVRLAKLKDRIMKVAAHRDAGFPERVVDVEGLF